MDRKNQLIAVGSTLLLALILGTISIAFLDEYGLALFLLTPLLIGFLPGYIISRKEEVTGKQIQSLGFKTLVLANIGLLVLQWRA